MINVLFFAQMRELVGTDTTEAVADFPTAEALRQHLVVQSDRWALALEDGRLLAAVNQTLMSFDHLLTNGDEMTLFPPVTEGQDGRNQNCCRLVIVQRRRRVPVTG